MISSKKISLISLALILVVLCFTVAAMLFPKGITAGHITGEVSYSDLHSVTYSAGDYYSDYTGSSPVKIALAGDTATAESTNVSVNGNEITVLGGGTYVLEGELKGNIIVNSADGAQVRLVMNGASIISEDFSPLYIKQAASTVISLAPGTDNLLADGSVYNSEKQDDGKPSAALHSSDDLIINGDGSLTVTGNSMDGIKANDTLKITGGTLKITAADDGINANDYIALQTAFLEITAGGDAVRCENEEKDKGFIALTEAAFTVTSGGDGISASSSLYADSSAAVITSGGGSETVTLISETMGGGMNRGGFRNQQTMDTPSAKGIKASDISITGGAYTIDSSDDAIHSDGSLFVSGGSFDISTGDDGVHAEKNVTLNPDTLNITKCREGIEGARIVIDGGDISVVSSDDGINAVGESSAGGGMPPMMGMHKETITEEDMYLIINGGNIYIQTGGDGVDSNAAAVLNGGTVCVYGPENSGNSSLDFEYGFVINGGSLLAAGSSGMAELPHDTSEQNSIVFYLDKNYDAGSTISVTDSEGNEIMSGKSAKQFSWVCVSNSALSKSSSYSLNRNGTQVSSVEVTDTVTSSGSTGRRMW